MIYTEPPLDPDEQRRGWIFIGVVCVVLFAYRVATSL